MNIKLNLQKVQMQNALNYLELVDVCEQNINMGNKVAHYILRKKHYANKYVEIMAAIIEGAIAISEVEIFNEAKL